VVTNEQVLIHVHTTTDKKTVNYAQFMWKSLLSLATNPNLIKLSVHCIGPSAHDIIARDFNDERVRSYIVERPDWMGAKEPMEGSSGHAACVDNALRMLDDGNIHIIADSDTVLVAKGWDDLIRNKLLVDNVGLLGVTYEDIGGFSSGRSSSQTYKNIPNVVWMAMSPKYSWRGLDSVRPRKGRDIPITNERESRTYNLPIGHSVLRDVGWQIPEYLKSNNIPCVGLRQLKPSGSEAIITKGLSDYHEEFHWEGTPLIVHQRGSLRHAYRTNRISIAFYSAVDTWIEREKLNSPRWTFSDDIVSLPTPCSGSSEISSIVDVDERHVVNENANNEIEEIKPISGWTKISVDGKPTKIRSPVETDGRHKLSVITNDGKLHHVRVEGIINQNLIIDVPISPTPYSLTVRNMTSVGVDVKCSNNSRHANVGSGMTCFLLVDVDGVIQM
jgi:hypothetical protein